MPKAAKANQKDLIREGQDARKGHCRDNLEWIISCLNNTNRDKDKIEDYENDLRDYIEFSVELMTNMNKIIGFSDEVTLQKFMSSIFNDKLEFEKEDYRTPKLNPSVNLIFL